MLLFATRSHRCVLNFVQAQYKMTKQKKAQLQMGENLVIIVIFFFLLVISVVFYLNIQKSRYAVKQYEYESRELLDAKTLISTMPEISCSENGDITESCLDIINLGFIQQYWNSIQSDTGSMPRDYYMYVFGDINITVKMLDPVNGVWVNEWVVYSNEPPDYTTSRVVFVPVSLYNATNSGYEYGLLEIRTFLK